jgi:bacterioferritin (cytochrome b1)
MADPDPMDVPAVLDALNTALPLQRRSVEGLLTASGALFGVELQAVAEQLWDYAQAELGDARQLIEKISALGGDPNVDVPQVDWMSDPHALLERLIEHEEETIAALHAVIPHSGQQPESEALEHLMEHLIMRKQRQVDWLRRALRRP